jgi:hypothetical protein
MAEREVNMREGHRMRRCEGAGGSYRFTKHADLRANARRLSRQAILAALEFGRRVHTRGAMICAIGRREVSRFALRGIDLSEFEGIQVVCDPDGTLITVYRNRDFSGLRPK